jgi:hypothetical protein
VSDRRRQLEPGAEARRRLEERARLGLRAQRPVQIVEQPPAAAPGKPFSRQAQELAERFDADAFQERKGLLFVAGGFKGYLGEAFAFPV